MTGASEQGTVVRGCEGTRAYEYEHLTDKQCGGAHALVPAVLVTRVLPTLVLVKRAGALTSYQSFFVKGSIAFFLLPFLPLVRRLFFLYRQPQVSGPSRE